METYYATPERALDATYRPSASDCIFEGYCPPGRFEHAQRQSIGVFGLLTTGYGLSSVLFETRYPASFYAAEVRDCQSNLVAEIRTGSGRKHGRLLADLCDAMAADEARLSEPPFSTGHWRKLKALYCDPASEGQDVDLFEHSSGSGWSLAAARPNGFGEARKSGCTLYVQDPALAERLATAMHEGMLTVKELFTHPM